MGESTKLLIMSVLMVVTGSLNTVFLKLADMFFFLTILICCTRCSSSWPTCRPPRTPPGRRRAVGFSSTIRFFRCKVICCSFPQLLIAKLPPCFSEGCSTSSLSFNFLVSSFFFSFYRTRVRSLAMLVSNSLTTVY